MYTHTSIYTYGCSSCQRTGQTRVPHCVCIVARTFEWWLQYIVVEILQLFQPFEACVQKRDCYTYKGHRENVSRYLNECWFFEIHDHKKIVKDNKNRENNSKIFST